MNRPIVYTSEIARAEDVLWGWRDTLEALGTLCADILGGTNTMFTGLSAGAQSPASLSVNITPGSGYQFISVDQSPYGSLPASSDVAVTQAINPSTVAVALSTAGLNSGQNMWALIEAQVQFSDVVRANDPSGGVLPFYNSANPTQPLQGQGGSGGVLPSERTAIIAFQVKYGTPASTGSEVPPNADSGWIGLYLIDLTFGQTQVNQSQILVAGPSVGVGVPSSYPAAPFIKGLLNQHHLGVPGSAPKINLSTEVQGTLGLANLPASDIIGILPTCQFFAGAPSGAVAGQQFDLVYDTVGNNLYICTTSGTAATAVWNKVTTVAGASPTGSAGGDLGGSYPNPSVLRINGVTVSGTPAANQVPAASGASAAAWSAVPEILAHTGAANLVGANDATNPNTTYDVTADSVIIRNSSDNTLIRITGFSANCVVVGSQTGSQANGRDQATAFSAATFFHLHVIGGGGQTPALLASLSRTAPTLPTSYTSFTYIATLRTDGSGNVMPMFLEGSTVYYREQQTVLGSGGATSPSGIGLTTFVPTIAKKVLIKAASVGNGSVGATLNFYIGSAAAQPYIALSQMATSAPTPSTMTFQSPIFFDIPNVSLFYNWSAPLGDNPSLTVNVTGFTVPNGSF